MATANLTTKDVARLLKVSEATVKRWADDGALPSEKTVGGHRRFSIQAVAQLRRQQGIAEDATAPGKSSADVKPLMSSSDFLRLIFRGDAADVSAALIDAYLNHTLSAVFDTTLAGAMHELGELWASGKLTIADEHMATRVVLNSLQKSREVIVPANFRGLLAICCGIEGDLHEVPVHLAEVILEAEGWDAINLGPNTPLFALREMVRQKRPQLVCISARMVQDLDRTAADYEQLRKVVAKIGAAVVFGGEAFRNTHLRSRFPAEFYATDFDGFVQFVRTLDTP